MTRKAYRLTQVPAHAPDQVQVGDTVYRLARHDYGLAHDDTDFYGVEHWAMTLDETGDYPSFTVPVDDLEPM